jgi:putative copper export protein
VTRALVQAIHVWAWAIGYGAITYTYYRLNQVMRQFTRSDDEYETYAMATLGRLHGWTFGALALAGVTGAMLALPTPAASARAGTSWSMLMAIKTAVLVVMIGVQAYVTWVMQPRRARAPRAASRAEERRFFRAALVLGFLFLVELVLGALTHLPTPHAFH